MLIHELVKLSGVSARTLRYYDEIGLLKPSMVAQNGYRHYSQPDIDRLQQILFYRALDFKLGHIKGILENPEFDVKAALKDQQQLLEKKRSYLDNLLQTISQTIDMMEGETTMTNEQKFEAFKQTLIEENEHKYGEEIREKYGEQQVLEGYGKLKEMTQQQYEAVQQLEQQLFARLQEALVESDPTSEVAMEAAELHKRWLSFYWKKYTKEAHVGLAQLYTSDDRFKAYYDGQVGEGATRLLHDAIVAYAKR